MKTLKQLREEKSSKVSLSDIPMIILLKRKSLRTYPDGITVVLYYSDKLKRYISVPFDGNSIIDSGKEQ